MVKKNSNFSVIVPFLIGLALAAGVIVGYFLSGFNAPQAGIVFNLGRSDKLRDVLNYIREEYVDTLNPKQLEEDAIVALLKQLDPHSAYIPASDFRAVSEQLEGNFEGIGVEFNIQRDTIMVVAAVTGGPSEQLGIRSGDRIVSVNGKSVAGVGITNERVVKELRGKGGTVVKVGIFRPGDKDIREFAITRGKIPLHSLDADYMLTPEIGYIKIGRFSATTFSEYQDAFGRLKSQGMKKLVLDLRDNPGGYLNAAVNLADEFLSKGRKIVYTQGKARKREDYNASSRGDFEEGGLVILIDEGSASASEIVAGAVQDNDRAWIVGRRSFGKGLVQEEVRFSDSSAMRLTIARYYTPAGRSIQKPYDKGSEAYFRELSERYERGEFEHPDTSRHDSIVFKTLSGRTVYGGGGITPDYFVPLDTSGYTSFMAEIAAKGLFNRFAFEYTDRRRKELLANYKDAPSFARNFSMDSVLPEFYEFVQLNGLKGDAASKARSKRFISRQLEALIGRNLFGNNAYFMVVNESDKAVQLSVNLLKNNKLVSSAGDPGTLQYTEENQE